MKIVDKSEWYRKEQEDEDINIGLRKAETGVWKGSLKCHRLGKVKTSKTIMMNEVQVRICSVFFCAPDTWRRVGKTIETYD